MARCTGCSREIQDHAAFCPYCGTQNRSGTPAKDVPPKTEPPKEAKPFDKPKPKKGEKPFDKPKPKKGEKSFDRPKPTKDKKPIDRQKPQKEELPDKAAKTPKKKPLADKVQSAREKKSRPAKEKIPKPVKAAKTGGRPKLSDKMKVVIIIAVTVVLVTAIITTGIVLTSRKTTFDFTTVQYTEQINKAAGEQLLDKETWKINGAFAVYEGDGFTITMETDTDSKLVKEICITPPDHPVAERIITYTITITKVTYYQKDDYIIFTPEPVPTTEPSQPKLSAATPDEVYDVSYDRGNPPAWEKRNDSKVYFYADPSLWTEQAEEASGSARIWGYKNITLYLYDYRYGEIITWGSKKGNMTDEGNNIWSFDFAEKNYELEDGAHYGVIVTADWGTQTCDLIFGKECFGDMIYMTGEMVENTVDASKRSYIIEWVNADPKKYATPVCVTSIGNVIGEVLWEGQTLYDCYADFVSRSDLSEIPNYNGKTLRQTLDDMADALGLPEEEKLRAWKENGITF